MNGDAELTNGDAHWADYVAEEPFYTSRLSEQINRFGSLSGSLVPRANTGAGTKGEWMKVRAARTPAEVREEQKRLARSRLTARQRREYDWAEEARAAKRSREARAADRDAREADRYVRALERLRAREEESKRYWADLLERLKNGEEARRRREEERLRHEWESWLINRTMRG